MNVRQRTAGAVLAAVVALVGTGCTWVQRANVDTAGNQANGYTNYRPSISADGRYVVFMSLASNLVAGDTNNAADVFVRDTATGTTTRISVDSAGHQANGWSTRAAVSADGRYAAFTSRASNLVAGDTNDEDDVFVHDMATGTTTRASVDSAGNQANGASIEPAVSADGRYVAFRSTASNLVAGDTNNAPEVFVRDTAAGTTTRVSIDFLGDPGNLRSDSPAVSANGRYVTFSSLASLTGDGNNTDDVFVRDRVAGTTSIVSVSSSGTFANADSGSPAISADGRYVAFSSAANTLVGDDTDGCADALNHCNDVFVRDTVAGTTTRVSVDSAGNEANGSSFGPAISADGRFVAFWSDASNLVSGDTNHTSDVFVRDTVAGTTTRVSLDVFGRQADGSSSGPAISAAGHYVSFLSAATNLVPEDTNGVMDVVVRANPQPTVTGIAPSTLPRGTTTAISITGSGFVSGDVVAISGAGLTLTGVTVVSPTQITAQVAVDADATPGARNVWVVLPGTGPGANASASGICASCATVT